MDRWLGVWLTGPMLWIVVVGMGTGLLGGLFGKGGSALASPLLAAGGVPAFAALASPLPATIPATAVAALAYWRVREIDTRLLRTTILFGVPATVVGALLSAAIGGGALVWACDVVLAALGLRILAGRPARTTVGAALPTARAPVAVADARLERGDARLGPADARLGRGDARLADGARLARLARRERAYRAAGLGAERAVALIAGLASGLLANSGGFLLAPLFITVLGLPIRRALGTSLAAAAILAIPGTLVHAGLGHVAWSLTIPFGLASVPLSAVGARLALRTDAKHLEVLYGAGLALLGGALLLVR
ncbi:MAG: sulfite exporter TauE/SafE family protein [Acidimicrobiales bacterium]